MHLMHITYHLSSYRYWHNSYSALAAIVDQVQLLGLWKPCQYLSLSQTSRQLPQQSSSKERTTSDTGVWQKKCIKSIEVYRDWYIYWDLRLERLNIPHKHKHGLEHDLIFSAILWIRPPGLINLYFLRKWSTIERNCSFRRCQNNPFNRRCFRNWTKHIECSLQCRIKQIFLRIMKALSNKYLLNMIKLESVNFNKKLSYPIILTTKILIRVTQSQLSNESDVLYTMNLKG